MVGGFVLDGPTLSKLTNIESAKMLVRILSVRHP